MGLLVLLDAKDSCSNILFYDKLVYFFSLCYLLYIVLLEHANLNCCISWKINFYHNKISLIFTINLASCSIFICEIKLNRIAYLISSISIVLFDLCVCMCVPMSTVCLCLVCMQICRFCFVWLHVQMHVYVHMEAWGDVEKPPSINSCNFLIEAGPFSETQTLLIWPFTLGSLVCTFRGWNYRWADTFTQN